MDLKFSPEETAFQEEIRTFLRENLSPELAAKVRETGFPARADITPWHKKLYEKGWAAPKWPVEHGGPGWSPMQRFIFDAELSLASAPQPPAFGIGMLAPVLIHYGSEAQKQRFLPKILSGEEYWCQGYSEPGSGSDLASLKTRAEDKGDHYLVNGQKIWTSNAHEADWIFCLVRTDPNAKQQEGISFLLIDMKTPGVEVKPIISINGKHSLNEVFFTDVKVPKENLVGKENMGWTYAKFLLGNERTGIAGVARCKSALERLRELAAMLRNEDGHLCDDPDFVRRFAAIETDLLALSHTDLRVAAAAAVGEALGPEASILKVKGTEIQQAISDLAVDALGPYAAPFDRPYGDNLGGVGPKNRRGVVPAMLFGRAASIYGGTNEVQRNIVAKAVLGL
ncbi:MAG TPA: acyl-CoA dehydrogenase family protein [Alphaproteobacteria bacterium]|nr:acyl-CoA dehydrogenase family protein [Alphaproteobacteria bacterium]